MTKQLMRIPWPKHSTLDNILHFPQTQKFVSTSVTLAFMISLGGSFVPGISKPQIMKQSLWKTYQDIFNYFPALHVLGAKRKDHSIFKI